MNTFFMNSYINKDFLVSPLSPLKWFSLTTMWQKHQLSLHVVHHLCEDLLAVSANTDIYYEKMIVNILSCGI